MTEPMIGSTVVMLCDGIDGIWKQGQTAEITRDEGASGLWAKFENGEEWNIGCHRLFEPDFLVLATSSAQAIKAELDNLKAAYEFLSQEYARVMVLSGYAESVEVTLADTNRWIDPKHRPAFDE